MPDTAEPSQRARLLTALSVGNEIIWLRCVLPELDLAAELDSALLTLAQGNSAVATAELASLDHQLASTTELEGQDSLAARARGRILVVSDALAEHGGYFDAGGRD